MAINFGALAGRGDGVEPLHPRDIFHALPDRRDNLSFLRGPQDQILNEWWDRRDLRDNVIKMNTGGGKTIVGLLLGQSSLAEGVGPVAYLVPDHYLAIQVIAEARRMGIAVTDDPKSFEYVRGKSILVAVFSLFFNGKSVFGVAGTVGRTASAMPPKTVIIDDAHACLAKAEEAFTVVIPSSLPVYAELLELFSDSIEGQSPASRMDLGRGHFSVAQTVPYWDWIKHKREVFEKIHAIAGADKLKFSWPLIADVVEDCKAVFTSDGLEISAPCVNSDVILGFKDTQRRIYLTATLADDGVLVTDFGADPTMVSDPITPANAGDIGDRLILIPQQTHPNVSSEEMRKLIFDISAEQNVAIIVPSRTRAAYWAEGAKMVLDKDNLAEGVEAMRDDPKSGLYVFLARYDGVDLPGDACHVLVVDGLPEALSGTERVEAAQLNGTMHQTSRQIQRIEQGMGRATRSNDDYCVVFLLGDRLAERLYGANAQKCFSPATRAQLKLSEEVGELFEHRDVASLREVVQQSLDRDPGWVKESRRRLATLRYEPARVSKYAVGNRSAFEAAARKEYGVAVRLLQEAIHEIDEDSVKAYARQQLAAYQQHLSPNSAQQTQKSANRKNAALLRPLEGVQYEKMPTPTRTQAREAAAYLATRYSSSNAFVIGMNALRADLSWGSRTKAFEYSFAELGKVLGFGSQMPEETTGIGPDGLWAMADGKFFVIEAKSGSKNSHPVYKDDAKQLSNAMDWFEGQYTSIATATPVLIHPRARFEKQAAVPVGCRVISEESLKRLREAIANYSKSLAENEAFRDPQAVSAQLAALRFEGSKFLEVYSEKGVRTA